MPDIVVYTAIAGGVDNLRTGQVWDGADFVAFVEAPVWQRGNQGKWQLRPVCNRFTDPAYNSKIHRCLPHLFLPGYKYSLWIDGNITLRVPIADVVAEFMDDADLALFKHPDRDTIHDELHASYAVRKYDNWTLAAQVESYGQLAHQPCNLAETGWLLRKHGPAITTFNAYWWAEICRWSTQCQLSYPIARDAAGIKTVTIPGAIQPSNKYLTYSPHG